MASQRLPAIVMARARKKLRVPAALRPFNQKEDQGVRPERVCGSRTCLPYKEEHFAPGTWVLTICLLLLGPESFEMVCELWTMTPSLFTLQKTRVRVSWLEGGSSRGPRASFWVLVLDQAS